MFLALSPGLTVLIAVLALLGLFLAIFFIKFFNLWIQALASKAPITLMNLVGMQLRKVNPTVIVRALISANQAGLSVSVRDVEAHYLAGGDVQRVITALIAADRANIALDFRRATAIDLAGRNVLDAVQTSVNPKVIDAPVEPGRKIAAMAKNGIQVLARARVTVRTAIDRVIGGATEETIIARVGEGIVSTIGSSNTHKDVLENPDNISKTVLKKGLDAGTAFEILSIDIADVDVGDNIGARLQADQAEADKNVAQAKAEERRAMAVASEQEYSAELMSNRAKLVLAEADVPRAIADALRSGNLGLMDYYRLKNIEADTRMRGQIAGTQQSGDAGKSSST